MGDENTPLPFCFTCNKVIQSVEGMAYHAGHNIGKKTFREIYDDAMHDTGWNRPD